MYKIVCLMSNNTGKKFGGRAKGTPNRITRDRREMLGGFLQDNFDEFVRRMKAIENPYEYCRMYVQILGFVLPKCSSITIKEEPHIVSLTEELDRISGERTLYR